MKKILISLFLITAVLITACNPKYKTINGCEIRPKTQCIKFDLREADLSEANLHSAYLHEAIYEHSTKFPEGFDPESAGMVLVEVDV